MLKVLYTINKVEHKCALSILYTINTVENYDTMVSKWVRFSLCQLIINKYNMNNNRKITEQQKSSLILVVILIIILTNLISWI